MARFLQTSDIHAGKPFARFPEGVSVQCGAARVACVSGMAALARSEGLRHVLVAGDVFDAPDVALATVRRVAEAMAEDPAITWWMIPGNHDPVESPVWDAWRREAVANVRLLDVPVAVEMEQGAWILPTPISAMRGVGDPTLAWEGQVTPEGVVRLGLAHGSAASFGSEVDPSAIDLARAQRLALDWVALGDWHGVRHLGPRAAYAGTPEPDRFGGRGVVLSVAADKAAASCAEKESGVLTWARTEKTWPGVEDGSGAAGLAARPKGLSRTMLWSFAPSGTLNPSGRAALEAAFARASEGCLFAEADWSGLSNVYDAGDAAALAPEGALRDAAASLMEHAAGEGASDRAGRALALLAAALEGTKP